jgi:hypothetical protein
MAGARIKTAPKKKQARAVTATRRRGILPDLNPSSRWDEAALMVIGAGLLLAAALILREAMWTTTAARIISAIAITASGGVIGWFAWKYSKGRPDLQRWHAALTPPISTAGIAITVIIGWNNTWVSIYLISAATLIGTWVPRTMPVIRGDGDDTHTKGVDPEALGLAPGTTLRRSSAGDVVIDHADGEHTGHVRGRLEEWESRLKLKPGTLLARVGGHRGQTRVTPVDVSALDKPVPWVDPIVPVSADTALSIADPIVTGKFADGAPFVSVFDSHSMTMGMTGSGKTTWALVKITGMLTRRDVCVLWCDPVKGVQSAGPVTEGVAWAAKDMSEAKAMVSALVRAIPARTQALAGFRDAKHSQGYTKWEPDAWTIHGMPLVYVQFEEAAWLIDHGALVKVAERARSAGIIFDMSLQRASHSRMDTDVRAQLARRTCFGVMDKDDASFALASDIIEAGACPDTWRDEKPGMFVPQGRDVPTDKVAMPVRGLMPTRNGTSEDLSVLAVTVTAHAHVRARLDPVTIEAFGPAYTNAEHGHASGTDTPTIKITDTSSVDTDDYIDDPEDAMPMPETEGVDLTGVDPNTPDDDDSADDVDFGDLTASRLPTGERNEIFRRFLVEESRNGSRPVSQRVLSNRWHSEIDGGGGKPWAYMRLGRLARLGLASQDEQDMEWWHLSSDPAAWSDDTMAVTGGDGGEIDDEG